MDKLYLTLDTDAYIEAEEKGKLTKLAINPETKRVTDVIIEEGLILKKAYALPISRVVSATGEEVHLNPGDDKDLTDFPAYEVQEHDVAVEAIEDEIPPTPPQETSVQVVNEYGVIPDETMPLVREETRTGVRDDVIVVDKSSEVHDLEEHIGYLYSVVVESETQRITELTFRYGLFDSHYLRVPAEEIDQMNEEGIHVTVSKDELEGRRSNIEPGEAPAADPRPDALNNVRQVE